MTYDNKPKNLPTVKKALYWDETEPDYAKKINLIAGKPQHMTAGMDFRTSFAKLNTPATSTLLTDGVIPTVINYDEAIWFKCARGFWRDIVYDIGKLSTIDGFCSVFMTKIDGGVYLPSNVRFAVSADAIEWETLYTEKYPTTDKPDDIVEIKSNFKKKKIARFVRFSFDVDVWVFIGQLEVFGTKKIAASATDIIADKPVPVDNSGVVNKYLMPEDFFGIHDLMLAYNCHPGREDQGKLSVEQLMPFVCYYNRKNIPCDYYFDAFLFLPFAAFPMRKPESNADTWRMYIDNTFACGYNTDALDFAFGQTKKLLGDENTDKRAKVFLSVLYPFKTQTNFGDLYGDGDMLDMSKLSDRKKGVKWLVDTQLKLWRERNYSHSELIGFYWFEEQFSMSDEGERELVLYITDYIRSLGFVSIWIPYFLASGYNKWREFGIDFACMQPNYSFTNESEAVIYATNDIVKRYGMCVEMEMGGTDEKYIDKYNSYLRVGVETGFMNSVHMYYQGGGPGEFYTAFKSDDKKLNNVYHDTYLFTKNKLEEIK